MQKYVVLYNALAGNGTGKESAEKLKDIIKDGELSFEDVTKISDFTKYLAELPEDTIPVLTGGDGTLSHLVNDIDTDNLSREILYYPTGSGNDFLNDVKETEKEVPFSLNKYLKKLPVVTVKGKTYKVLNGVGYGIDGYCCEVGDKIRESKTDTKPINYTSIAIKGLLFHYKPTNAEVTMDGVTKTYKKVWLVPTMNGRFYGGGMIPTPDQKRLSEERFISSMVYHNAGKLKALIVFPKIFKGEHVKKTAMVEILKGKEVTVKFDRPVALQVDGETILDVSEYTMKVSE